MALTPAASTSPLSKQENLAESFEKAFQACHACLTHPEGYLRTDHEETRATGTVRVMIDGALRWPLSSLFENVRLGMGSKSLNCICPVSPTYVPHYS